MFRIPDSFELKLHGVADRGVANKERIILRAWDYGPVDLAPYVVTVGYKIGDGAAPVFDALCWLGEHQIAARQWLFVYTGPGTKRSSETDRGEHLYVVHWNRAETLFNTAEAVPVLMRMGAVAVERSPDYVLNPPQADLPLGLADVAKPSPNPMDKLRDLYKLPPPSPPKKK